MGSDATEMSAVFGVSVNCDPVDVLLDLLENSNGRVPARAARERFGDALVYLEQIGAVQPDERLSEVTCNECQLHHSAPLEFDTSIKAYRFFCPQAGLVAVRDADVASLCVTPGWLSGWLARTLSLLPHIRHRTLIENQAWLLGETVLDGTSVAVALLLGRLAANEQDVLIQELSRFHPSEIGIVLTTSADLSHTLVASHRYHALDLREIVRAHTEGLALDRRRLGLLVKQLSSGVRRPRNGAGGRPSHADDVLKLFKERRAANIPYLNKSAEARAMRAGWLTRFPSSEMPGLSTIRSHLPGS
jgi:hypothetical protein